MDSYLMFSSQSELDNNNRKLLSISDKYIPDDIPYGVSFEYDPELDELKLIFNYGESQESRIMVNSELMNLAIGSKSGRPYDVLFKSFVKNLENLKHKYNSVEREMLNYSTDSRRKSNNVELIRDLINNTIKAIRPNVLLKKNSMRR